MMKHALTGGFLLAVLPLLASCWGGPSKADLEDLYKIKIEYVECISIGGSIYECSGKTANFGFTFKRRVLKADGRWRSV